MRFHLFLWLYCGLAVSMVMLLLPYLRESNNLKSSSFCVNFFVWKLQANKANKVGELLKFSGIIEGNRHSSERKGCENTIFLKPKEDFSFRESKFPTPIESIKVFSLFSLWQSLQHFHTIKMCILVSPSNR